MSYMSYVVRHNGSIVNLNNVCSGLKLANTFNTAKLHLFDSTYDIGLLYS